jgi:signal transduction histidine kinase
MDLNQVIREVVPLVRGELLRHGLSLRLDLEPAVPRVWGDVVELQQVLINLVANGMEASAPGPDSSADLAICTRHGDAGGVLIAVVDGGAGLSDAAAGRMFDAFFTTKPNGMGMGLAICRSIVEAHGGRIWASNNAGRGATVHIALPRHPDIES